MIPGWPFGRPAEGVNEGMKGWKDLMLRRLNFVKGRVTDREY